MIDRFSGYYEFLSNFYPSEVEYKGIKFPTVEHAFQAAKCKTKEEMQKFTEYDTPGKAKRAGRKVDLRNDWEDVKLNIMDELLKQKFSNPAMAEKLLETKNEFLVEGNNWNDTFWGVCDRKGENHLGVILMKLRSELLIGIANEYMIESGWSNVT
ncbi:MAG: NADAR family protein [Methanobrevibacter sp.]|nr:NADAR family protein [Methanobrevibacter sp.]